MKRISALCVVLGMSSIVAAAPFTVRIRPNLPSPQPVGNVVALIPQLDHPPHGMLVFRYSVSVDGGSFHVVRDFSQQPDFLWSPELYEHDSSIRLTVRDNATKEMVEAELPFRIVTRVKGQQASVTPTVNPVVALFSAPPCPEGSQFRVEFQRLGSADSGHTSLQPCRGNRSSNQYVAGIYADAEYRMRSEVVSSGASKTGDWLTFHTGLLDGRFPLATVIKAHSGSQSASEPLIVRSTGNLSNDESWTAMAWDLEGRAVWYLNTPGFLTRVLPGGRFLMLGEGANSENSIRHWQVVKEVDLLGNSIRETNVSRVAEQLAARGIVSRCKKDGQQCVSGFHHEAIRLPNGHTLVIGGLERMFPDGAQGSKDPVDIMGDLIIDLDEDFQVSWVWNSFDHIDLKRASISDEKCKFGPGSDGCASVFLADQANGWLHSNSLDYVKGSGDLLVSIPEQDWVIKIDYKDGKGSGKVLWRLGLDGDFTVKSTDPDPWFSYQHDARMETVGSNRLLLIDDGHRRQKKDPKANNRGQVWELDENTHTATLVYNADLGIYSIAVGSAQRLSGGGYTFESGFVNPPAPFSQTTETAADGKVAYAQQVTGGLTYRSFRVRDLYTVP